MKILGFTFKQAGLWIIAALLFAAHQLAERFFDIHQLQIDNYFDAFLFPVIVIPLILADTRRRLKDHSYKFPPAAVSGVVAGLVIVSEIIFPALSDRFVADKIDALLIIAGGLLYYFIFNSGREIT